MLDKLSVLQRGMELKLEEIQLSHKHKGNRGDNSEEVVRDFLREFLPLYNRIGHGEIVDTIGNVSNESDIVILNEYHPYLNDLANPSLFFIEGVAAVGEVKSNLSSKDLSDTLDKCTRFKQMHIDMQGHAFVVANDSDIKRFVMKRPFFLFIFASQLKLDTILEKIRTYNEQKGLEVENQIDGVFALDRGTIFNVGDGEGSLGFKEKSDSSKLEGYISIEQGSDNNTLFNFLTFLSSSMPHLRLHYPIIREYLR
ncbi:DUF6602 domain-containing protein [Pontibacillus salipaludis]|uniref:DUF6602 domain-containing protein n=1 Tax=Pontibacillus salipaludis TaxID=1697394 RepID=A0ABQ1PIR4_9BACI|nr:DUF6602 domain-containing protein [Pontibacillus salipaludis]GGC97840.1 hypothetical protein GCM10011389_01210 [Pontibacillus salipaludis]